jgi:hypothetical protein
MMNAMSGDERIGEMRRPRAAGRPTVAPGPLAELKELVYELYLAAGTPTLDQIVGWVREDEALAGSPGRDTVSRIISDPAVPPSQADLTAVVTVLAQGARWDPGDAAERARELWVAARMARPVGAPLEEVTDPFALEVHRTVEIEGAAGLPLLPPYIPRSHDAQLVAAAVEAAAGRSCIALLVGGSSSGKTRACWEALEPLRRAGGWRLWHPIAPSRVDALLEGLAGVGARTVIWLNEAQEYLGGPDGERVAAGLRELIPDSARRPVLVLATLWPSYWNEFVRRPTGGPDAHNQARELLSGLDISVPATFTADQIQALLETGDARLSAAAGAEERRVTQFLAGAPELVARYRNALPAARALIDAAMDARRLGMGEAIPLAFLEAAAPGYLSDTEWEEEAVVDDWLERALADTAEPRKGVRGPLSRIHPRPGTSAVAPGSGGPMYRLADYLDQYGRRVRDGVIVPTSFWDAAVGCAASLGGTRSLATAALDRELLRYAAVFNKWAAVVGETGAASSLIMSMYGLHPGDDAPAWWAAEHTALDNPLTVAGLLVALRTVGASAQVAALIARNPAAYASLDDSFAVGSLLGVLREAGEGGQAMLLGERAVAHVPLQDSGSVAALLDVLLRTWEDEQVAALVARNPASHALVGDPSPVGDPFFVAALLEALREAGADEQAEILAKRAATDTPLDEPSSVAFLLAELRTSGFGAQVATLIARNPAGHASLDDPSSVADLLDALRLAGEDAQVAVLVARNPAGHASFNEPAAVGSLLEALLEAGEVGQAAVLLARNPAVHVPLSSGFGVGMLLDRLRAAGADEQAEILAERAATETPLDDSIAVVSLLRALRRAAADAPIATLLARDPAAHVPLTNDMDGVQILLRTLRSAGEDGQAGLLTSRLSAAGLFRILGTVDPMDRYVFGRTPDGRPADSWGWDDLE